MTLDPKWLTTSYPILNQIDNLRKKVIIKYNGKLLDFGLVTQLDITINMNGIHDSSAIEIFSLQTNQKISYNFKSIEVVRPNNNI